MAGTLSAGVNSLILKLDQPYDTIRTTDIRDDLIKVKVWCSATPNFTPVDTVNALGVANVNPNQVFDGLSLSIVISEIPALPTPTTWFVPAPPLTVTSPVPSFMTTQNRFTVTVGPEPTVEGKVKVRGTAWL